MASRTIKGADTRVERDSMGEVAVPSAALWGAQTERARHNFRVGGDEERMPLAVIGAIALIKQAAAVSNRRLGVLDPEIADVIVRAAEEVVGGTWNDQFPLSIWQSGSGTQSNMNVNEVIANRANFLLEGPSGVSKRVHPNDHVNLGQSSNDVVAAALHLAASRAFETDLRPELVSLVATLDDRSTRWRDVVKVGRTHLQDATPITVGQEWSGHAAMVRDGLEWLDKSVVGLERLPLGATAVGTGLNSAVGFGADVVRELAGLTGRALLQAPNLFAALATLDDLVRFSGALSTVAGSLFKLANDLRWLGSGPRAGLGELALPENEPGSSIMPGKVNPSQAEVLMMVALQVMGNDTAVGIAGSQGNFQLNTFRPLIGSNVLRSITLLAGAIHGFRVHLIEGLELDRAHLSKDLAGSLMLVTALVPEIGYERAAEIANRAHTDGSSLRDAAIASGVGGDLFDRVVSPGRMTSPAPR